MANIKKVLVTAQSFAGDQRLRQEAVKRFPNIQFSFAEKDLEIPSPSFLESYADADAWIVGKEPVADEQIRAFAQLKGVSKYGVGLDNIDFEACRRHGVEVYFESGVNAQEVAEQSIGMMLGLCRNLFASAFKLKNGEWWKNGGENLSGKTLGIIGCGNVGEKVLRLARAFDCEVLVHDIVDKSDICHSLGARQCSLDELLAASNIISLHLPLDSSTKCMVNSRFLNEVRDGAFLINTCRGEVIDESALYLALQNGPLAGAAADVFCKEPSDNNPLNTLDNFWGTAHIAGNSREAIWKMGSAALNGLEKFLLDL